jgi:hypothetical protein
MLVKRFAFLMIFLAVGCLGMAKLTGQDEAPRMEKEELKVRLGSPELVVIDVRYGKDWTDSDRMVAGAIREDPKNFDAWQDKYPKTKTLVLYCA